MRRYRREQRPTGMFRGAELMRLTTGLVMLGVLYMLYAWMRQPDTWRWLADADDTTSSSADPAERQTPPVEALPAAVGPTDEDPDQAEEVRQEFQAIADGTLKIQREEMEPYDRLVFWVKNQSFDRLRQRARSDLLFTNFHDEPDKYRGQLVTMKLNVRRILNAGDNRDGIHLYEVWGSTRESRDRLYVAMVVDLPKGMPIGPSVHETARFVGYFLKLQGYHSAGAKPDAVPDKAPLLIGRLRWEPIVAPPEEKTWEWVLGLSLLAVIGAVLVLRLVYSRMIRRKPAPRSITSDAATGEVIPIDAWLERSGFGADEDESNVADENGQRPREQPNDEFDRDDS